MVSCANSSLKRPAIQPTTSVVTLADRWDHLLARWGVRRSGHRIEPGLYALGHPTSASPVFVTANYTLSFDALRSALAGIDGYILVLDTQGINVWCAAGKGTFGTDELVRRIEATALGDVVSHRVLILPQLGAAGVAAHEVKRRSGFKVEYGPVGAADLPEYLKTRRATPEMRQVRFTLRDRARRPVVESHPVVSERSRCHAHLPIPGARALASVCSQRIVRSAPPGRETGVLATPCERAYGVSSVKAC